MCNCEAPPGRIDPPLPFELPELDDPEEPVPGTVAVSEGALWPKVPSPVVAIDSPVLVPDPPEVPAEHVKVGTVCPAIEHSFL
ncbi:hypothetical protein NP233_g470 [Leucocoprinus birnbaumii]|uniref:Uncharacterized protein n=1 Tax=Leucocoprinus birnbaumii TaxID=56174 RepID=A0AAD5YWN6_9AGAR|nr:hypothetical protein NP233_g470 [Leucocoprinus birnbaumii]